MNTSSLYNSAQTQQLLGGLSGNIAALNAYFQAIMAVPLRERQVGRTLFGEPILWDPTGGNYGLLGQMEQAQQQAPGFHQSVVVGWADFQASLVAALGTTQQPGIVNQLTIIVNELKQPGAAANLPAITHALQQVQNSVQQLSGQASSLQQATAALVAAMPQQLDALSQLQSTVINSLQKLRTQSIIIESMGRLGAFGAALEGNPVQGATLYFEQEQPQLNNARAAGQPALQALSNLQDLLAGQHNYYADVLQKLTVADSNLALVQLALASFDAQLALLYWQDLSRFLASHNLTSPAEQAPLPPPM